MGDSITQLTGGATPADPANPQTFPAVWNAEMTKVEKFGIIDVQEYNANGTWTKPAGAKIVEVIAFGAGGAGGWGRHGAAGTVRFGGNGGQAGRRVHAIIQASSLSATETVTIGLGGARGAIPAENSNGTAGLPGGVTRFGTAGANARVEAAGGVGGLGGTTTGPTVSVGTWSPTGGPSHGTVQPPRNDTHGIDGGPGSGGGGGALTAANVAIQGCPGGDGGLVAATTAIATPKVGLGSLGGSGGGGGSGHNFSGMGYLIVKGYNGGAPGGGGGGSGGVLNFANLHGGDSGPGEGAAGRLVVITHG